MLTVINDPTELRQAARRGEWRRSTAGHCPGHQQANVVILPAAMAAEFASFCSRNPKPCPVIEILPPGEWRPALSAPEADVRTDVPGYRVYERGHLREKPEDLLSLWRDDLVCFLLGCSHTFEHALSEAGVPLRHVERGTTVPMFLSSLPCRPAGRFRGRMVVTMRPVRPPLLPLVLEISARYPHAHGLPLHVGDPGAIGISDLGRPDFGDPVPIEEDEVPVFWGCGVTPQAAVREAEVELLITHEPGRMFVTDLPRESPPGVAVPLVRGPAGSGRGSPG
jgi:uncharacterized protein YcsI (UPF0317 family)